MSGPILATKLYMPLPRPDRILRARLHKQLSEGLYRKLTLISAPAGFGKTTLLSGWVTELHSGATSQEHQTQVAWVSLDAQDSDPTRFLTYVVAALQTIDPDLGSNVMERLQAPQSPPLEAMLTGLINQLATVAGTIVLVLDDFHLVDAKPIDDCVAFLLEHLPPRIHVTLVTREDPSLPLARYRARSELTEVRSDDLRFSPTEAADFLKQSMGLKLTETQIAALEQRTEGWIAGLQLAALSMQGRTDIAGFVQAFTGSHRFVLDYLIEEVLKHQSDRVRQFLLQTSILEQLSGPLCDAVCSRQDGQMMLESLERGNLFVVPLDDERRWYRYHHLFSEVLQLHLREDHSDQVPVLHRRASAWYEQNCLQAGAIHHAFAAQDLERAACLIELTWPAIFNGFQPATWLDWVRGLPEEIVRMRPVLCVGYAWTLLDCGELHGVGERLRDAERWLDAPTGAATSETEMLVVNEEEFQSLPSTIAMGRAYLAHANGDEDATAKYARQALDLLPADEYYWRGIAAMFLGLAYQTGGDLDTAYQYFAGSVASLHKAGHIHFQLTGTVALADILVTQGRLRDAIRTYERSLQFVEAQGTHARHGEAILHVGLGELYFEQGDQAYTEEHLQQAEDLAGHALSLVAETRLYTLKARIEAGQGEFETALDLLNQAEQVADQARRSDLHSLAALRT